MRTKKRTGRLAGDLKIELEQEEALLNARPIPLQASVVENSTMVTVTPLCTTV
jgi:hypothetical protein